MKNKENIELKISGIGLLKDREERLEDELSEDYHSNDSINNLLKSLSDREKNIFRIAFRQGYFHGNCFITEGLFSGASIDDFIDDKEYYEESYKEVIF